MKTNSITHITMKDVMYYVRRLADDPTPSNIDRLDLICRHIVGHLAIIRDDSEN